MIVTIIEYVIVNFRARFVNLGHRKKRQSVERMIDKARLAATKKQSRSTDVETCPSSPLTGTRQFVASSLLTRADNQNNQSHLTGTETTQSSYGNRSHTESSCGDRDLPK